MTKNYKLALGELKEKIRTGIFWPDYTHVSGSSNRDGISKLKKLLSPSIAIANGIVPFSGELFPYTFLFRMYHVSVSVYPPREHKWEKYLGYGAYAWSPQLSKGFIKSMRQEIEEISREPLNRVHFEDPSVKEERLIRLEENIRFEEERQKAYSMMLPAERARLRKSKPEIYLFGQNLPVTWKELFGKNIHAQHPFVPGEISLLRYLIGMFTSSDTAETKEWISKLLNRDIPVASIDALATWEQVFDKLPSYHNRPNTYNFFHELKQPHNEELRKQVVSEVTSIDEKVLQAE